jgi:hypothetical protein
LISDAEYQKLEEKIKLVKYPTHAISQAKALNEKIESLKNITIAEQLK